MRAVEDHHVYGEYKVSSSTQTAARGKGGGSRQREKDRRRAGRRRRKSERVTSPRRREIARREDAQNGVYSDAFNLRVRKDEIVGPIVYACAARKYIPENAGHRSWRELLAIQGRIELHLGAISSRFQGRTSSSSLVPSIFACVPRPSVARDAPRGREKLRKNGETGGATRDVQTAAVGDRIFDKFADDGAHPRAL